MTPKHPSIAAAYERLNAERYGPERALSALSRLCIAMVAALLLIAIPVIAIKAPAQVQQHEIAPW